jgi:hypothetical protein
MWGEIIGAGIGAASSLIGGKSQNSAAAAQAAQQNAFQEAQNQKQMDFQERMRKTQYQTAVADIKSAGLNPMLAYTQGGAGTPTGATSSGASAPVENVMHTVGQSAKEGWQAYQTWKNAQQQQKLMESQTEAQSADAAYKTQLSVSEILKQPNIPIQGKKMLAELAWTNVRSDLDAQRTKTEKEKTTNEKLGITGGKYGIATRAGIEGAEIANNSAKDAANWYNKNIGKPFSDWAWKNINQQRDRYNQRKPK